MFDFFFVAHINIIINMVQHFIYLAVIFAMLTMVMYLTYDSYCASNDERCKTLSMTFLALFGATTAVMLGIIAYNASRNGSSYAGGGGGGGGYARQAPARPYYANANANGNARMRE